jgi:hypothetical protein
VVAAAGFGALCVFWLLGDWREDVPGLLDYRSATVGDGLLLPTITVILYAVVRSPSLIRPAREAASGTGAALVGVAAGALTQALWLADDSPVKNWSFPRAHNFNVAGWYHAVFLTAVSGLMCGLAVMAARRVRATRRVQPANTEGLAASPWVGLLFGAGIAMTGLIAIDNERAGHTAAGVATTAALSASTVAGLALLLWAFGRQLRLARRWLAAGLISAAALCLALT